MDKIKWNRETKSFSIIDEVKKFSIKSFSGSNNLTFIVIGIKDGKVSRKEILAWDKNKAKELADTERHCKDWTNKKIFNKHILNEQKAADEYEKELSKSTKNFSSGEQHQLIKVAKEVLGPYRYEIKPDPADDFGIYVLLDHSISILNYSGTPSEWDDIKQQFKLNPIVQKEGLKMTKSQTEDKKTKLHIYYPD